MAQLRVGIVGCGQIARAVHIPVLRRLPRATVVALADPSSTALAAAAGLVPGASLDEDPAALIERVDIDAVVVCASTALHGPLAVAALEAGKHLYLEKPLAVSLDEGARAVDAARRAGTVAAIGFNRRFHPAFVRLRRLLRGGRAGDLVELRTQFLEPVAATLPDWKRRRETGGGALLDLASHHIDLVRFLTGEDVVIESAAMRSIASDDDDAQLVLRCGGGARAVIDVSFNRRRADVIEARCQHRTLRADRHAAMRARLRPGWDPSYAALILAFVDRVHGAPVEIPTLEDGLRSLEIVIAAESMAA